MIKKLLNSFALITTLVLILLLCMINYTNASSLESINTKAFVNYKDAYNEFLDLVGKESKNGSITYTLSDINRDGVPELIILNGDVEATKEYEFYTFNSGKIVNLGKTTGGHSVLYEMNNQSYLMRLSGQMGYQTINKVEIVSNKIKETELSSKEIAPGNDYDKGDVELVFKDYSDKSLLNVYEDDNDQKSNKTDNNLLDSDILDNKNPIVNEDRVEDNSTVPSESVQYMTVIIIAGVSILVIIAMVLFLRIVFRNKK